MFTSTVKSTVAVSVLLAICAVTQAAVITETETFSGIPTFTRPLTFDKFDNLGGSLTLDSIQVTLDLNITGGYLILDNDSDQSASGDYEFGAKGNISSTDVALLNASFQPVTAELGALHADTFSLAADNGDGGGNIDPSLPDGMQYNGGSESDSDSGFIGSTVFSQYIGSGTYVIDVDITQWFYYDQTGGIEMGMQPVSADCYVTVLYTYTPEPATLSLLALGSLALLRRRKK